MAIRITIPEPCSENWNAMTPQGDGRHCAQCCKVVVDFTGMEPREITDYLMQHREQKVCGRFSNAHLDTPLPWTPEEYTEKVALSPLTWLQKVAAIVVLAFGLMAGGCTMGVKSDTSRQSQVDTGTSVLIAPPDSTRETLGKIASVPDDTTQQKTSGKTGKVKKPECVGYPSEAQQTMGIPEWSEPVVQGAVQVEAPDSTNQNDSLQTTVGELQIMPDTARSGPAPSQQRGRR